MSETIGQRYNRTTSWTALHILAEQMMTIGRFEFVQPSLERKLRTAEAEDMDLSADTDD